GRRTGQCPRAVCAARVFGSAQQAFAERECGQGEVRSRRSMQAVADQLDLDVLNPSFEKMDAQKIIDWSFRQFGDDLVMTSSFGDQAVVLIHLATQFKPDIKIIFVDTG